MMGVIKRTLLVCGLMSNLVLVSGQMVVPDASAAQRMCEKSEDSASLESVFRKYDPLRLKIPLDNKDIELLIGGNIKVDSYNVRNGTRLTKGVDDQVNQWRQRFEVAVQSNFGKDSHDGRAVVESHVALGGALFWRSGMTRDFTSLEGVASQDFINPPVNVFLNESWVTLNLDTLTSAFEIAPHSIKAGFFPFMVGRGFSLGDRSYGGVTYMGFPRQGIQTYMPKYAPGLLLHGELPTSNLSYDLYYSPMVAEDVNQFVQTSGRSAHVSQKDDKNAHGRHLVAASLHYLLEPVKSTTVRLEPYFVYYNSQRQTVASPGDSPMKFMTFGLMTDASVGPVKFNLEMATQTGKQEVLPWEYRYVGDVTTKEFRPGYDVKLGGSMLVFDMAYQVKDLPVIPAIAMGYFSGGDYPYNDTVSQFHAGEGSYATLLQAQQASATQRNKTFKGFLPLRDWGYRGMWCNPLIMFSAGVVPRPVDVDISALTAFNDQDCATNLMFLGVGGTWYPLEKRKSMSVSGGMFFHWEANSPHAWSKEAIQPGQDADVLSTTSSGSVKSSAPDYGIHGWYLSKRASAFLGTELNMVVDYQVAQDCGLSVRGGIFFPGQLYADLAGQPNQNSYVVKDTFTYASSGVPVVTSVTTNDGLGHSPAYGLYTRLSYAF